jgi:hypothetical protein
VKGYEHAYSAIHFHLRVGASWSDAGGIDLCVALYRTPENLPVKDKVPQRFAIVDGDDLCPDVEGGGRDGLKSAVLVVIPEVLKISKRITPPSSRCARARRSVLSSIARLRRIDHCPVSRVDPGQLGARRLAVPGGRTIRDGVADPAAWERYGARRNLAACVEEGKLEREMVKSGA